MNTTGNSLKTAIIMVSYDRTPIFRNITSTALGNIQMFTDREDYEMILVENEPLGALNRKYQLFFLDHHIVLDEDIGVSASRNMGAKAASSDIGYYCFIDNDVFVWEGWLPKLRFYLESGNWDAVCPHQCQTTREFVKRSYEEEEPGNDDAGLLLMTKEAFERTGGWDERFFSVYHDAGFRKRMGAVGIRKYCTNQVIISHLNGATTFNLKDFRKKLKKEGDALHNRI